MEGDLNADNHKIINLSDPVDDGDVINKSYLESTTFRRDGGDLNMSNNKIVNLSEPTEVQDAVTKQYVDSRKPLITIWAQENGPLNAGEYEWSFGSGDLYTQANCGYCMPAAGRILRGSISSVSDDTTAVTSVSVQIVINGQAIINRNIGKRDVIHSYTRTYTPPIEVAQDDRINFQTYANNSDATNTIVSLLIELDMKIMD